MQHWVDAVLELLPATVREINLNPRIQAMNEQHHKEREGKRKGRGTWLAHHPLNSMAYDTLYYLRRKGVVYRDVQGVYRRIG